MSKMSELNNTAMQSTVETELTPQDLIKVMCEWDSVLAPLTDRQRELCLDLQYMSFDNTYNNEGAAGGGDIGLTPTTTNPVISESSLLQPSKAGTVVEQSKTMLGVVQDLRRKTNATLAALNRVSTEFQEAWNKMNSMYATCEALEGEKNRLLVAADSMKDRLEPFQALEQISIKVHSRSIKTTSPEFLQQLARLATNIQFLEENSHFKEAEDFLDGYNAIKEHAFRRVLLDSALAMDKALPLAAGSTNEPAGDVDSQRQAHDVTTPGQQFQLTVTTCEEQLYTNFQTETLSLQPLYAQIERISLAAPAHIGFASLLTQLEQLFCSKREKISMRLVSILLEQLVAKHPRDICQFSRSACALLIRVCSDEYNIYHTFFQRPNAAVAADDSDHYLDQQQSTAFEHYLSRLCDCLYETIRPLILNCNHVEQLSQLCLILASEAFAGYAADHPNECGAFSHAVGESVLSDAQERLVYRTSVYISEQIAQYKPSAGDLAYPEKLLVMQNVVDDLFSAVEADDAATPHNNSLQRMHSSASTVGSTVSAGGGAAAFAAVAGASQSRSPADLPGLWYVPVRRVLTLMKRLSQSVDVLTFSSLVHDTITSCLDNLAYAANLIRSQQQSVDYSSKNSISKKDAIENSYLFYIKHVMILREAVMQYHHSIEFSVEHTDIDIQSSIKRFAKEFFVRHQQQQQQPPSPQIEQLSTSTVTLARVLQSLITASHQPLVEERQLKSDARVAIDDALRTACRVLIDTVVQTLVGPVLTFINKADVAVQSAAAAAAQQQNNINNNSSIRLSEHSFAGVAQVREMLASIRERLMLRIAAYHKLFRLYMGDTANFSVLFRAVFDRVVSSFAQLQRILLQFYTSDERQLIQCPEPNDVARLILTVCSSGASTTSASQTGDEVKQHHTDADVAADIDSVPAKNDADVMPSSSQSISSTLQTLPSNVVS